MQDIALILCRNHHIYANIFKFFGKETIGADAERYVAERLIETAKKKNSIVIPLQMEKE